jgi:preprotein translocase SecF subunit
MTVGLVRFLPLNPKLKCIEWRSYNFAVAIMLFVLALGAIAVRGFNTSIDFNGGTVFELQAEANKADTGALQEELNALETVDIRVKTFGSPRDVLVELRNDPNDGSGERQAVTELVRETVSESGYLIRRVETIEPELSRERLVNSLLALAASLAVIFAYFSFRYGVPFALGAVITTVFDVGLIAGMYALFQLEITMLGIAAILTIMGYSLNDTVVVYNRIRSLLRKNKNQPVELIIAGAIDNTIWRTLITSLAAFVAMAALAVLGGEVIGNFALVLMVGIVLGTLSTPFLAAPLLLPMGVKKSHAAPTPVAMDTV